MSITPRLSGLALIAATALTGCKEQPEQRVYHIDGNTVTLRRDYEICNGWGDSILTITSPDGVTNTIYSCRRDITPEVNRVVITGTGFNTDTDTLPKDIRRPILAGAQKKRDEYVSRITEQIAGQVNYWP